MVADGRDRKVVGRYGRRDTEVRDSVEECEDRRAQVEKCRQVRIGDGSRTTVPQHTNDEDRDRDAQDRAQENRQRYVQLDSVPAENRHHARGVNNDVRGRMNRALCGAGRYRRPKDGEDGDDHRNRRNPTEHAEEMLEQADHDVSLPFCRACLILSDEIMAVSEATHGRPCSRGLYDSFRDRAGAGRFRRIHLPRLRTPDRRPHDSLR